MPRYRSSIVERAVVVIFVCISRHTPETCPIYNEGFKKQALEHIQQYLASRGIDLDHAAAERENLVKKHGITEVGRWFVPSEHITYSVLDVPSIEAYRQFEAEFQSPLMRASTTEIQLAVTREVAMHLTLADARLSESEKHILQKIIEHFL